METANNNAATTQDEVARYVADAEQRLSAVIRSQFRYMIMCAVLVMAVVGLITLATWLTRAPSNTQVVEQLAESNSKIADVGKALLQAQPSPTTTNRALEVVIQQAELHQTAVEEIRRSLVSPSPEAQSILQLFGGAVVAVLLGVLGLQRLQNIDSEINNVRQSVFQQIESRAVDIRTAVSNLEQRVTESLDDNDKRLAVRIAELKESLDAKDEARSAEIQAQIRNRVDQVFEENRQRLNQVERDIAQKQQAFNSTVDKTQADFQDRIAPVLDDVDQVNQLLMKYPWLTSRDTFDAANRIDQIASVEEAQDLAENFRTNNDIVSAKVALRRIIERSLPGGADDFHNAHSEAMRLKDVQLGLDLADAGLDKFNDQYDLIADKVLALRSVGRANDARVLFEEWRQRNPDEFTRSWRPVVFYVDTFKSLKIDPELAVQLEQLLKDAVKRAPYEIKVWSAYSQYVRDRGRIDDAEAILIEGLRHNPFSQQINYVMGELLLSRGRADEAAEFLEKALSIDFQDQFQHDVNQFSLRATLAQAYEAKGERDRARLIYESIVGSRGDPSLYGAIFLYARNRLAALDLVENKTASGNAASTNALLELLSQMQQATDGKSGEVEPDSNSD